MQIRCVLAYPVSAASTADAVVHLFASSGFASNSGRALGISNIGDMLDRMTQGLYRSTPTAFRTYQQVIAFRCRSSLIPISTLKSNPLNLTT